MGQRSSQIPIGDSTSRETEVAAHHNKTATRSFENDQLPSLLRLASRENTEIDTWANVLPEVIAAVPPHEVLTSWHVARDKLANTVPKNIHDPKVRATACRKLECDRRKGH